MKNYLISCSSYKKIDTEVKKIIGTSLNVIKYDLREETIEDVINEANYFSLTGENKYIIFKCEGLFKNTKTDENDSNKDTKILESYLESPALNTTIIFVTTEFPDKRKKIYKLLEKNGVVNCLPDLNKKELVYECMNILSEHGYKVSYEVALYIAENSYLNYDILLSEISKIELILKPQELTLEKIKDIVSVSISNTTFQYISCVINGDLNGAIQKSKNFKTLKIDGSMIIVLLAKEFEIYYLLKSLNDIQMVQSLFHKEDWQMREYINKSRNFSLKEIKKIIIKLNDYDYKVKSGFIDHDIVIDLLTLDLC